MSFDNSTLRTEINIKMKTSVVQNFMGFQHCSAKFSTTTDNRATKVKA